MTEEIIVIAMRAVGQTSLAANSRIRHCKECGFAVWVAPSSPQDAKAICNQCAVDLLPWDDPDLKIMEPSDAQKEELIEFFGKKS